jgi:4-carboxymuconolactone decarboxylase
MDQERIAKGIELLKKMEGAESIDNPTGERVRFEPWEDWTRRVLFGEAWSRTEIDLKTRSLCTIAALTVLHRPHLEMHINSALNNGATTEEIVEVIMHSGFYGGWPVTVTGLKLAYQVFEKRGV